MISIARHVDPATIVAQIRMERQTHKGSFLLLEGSTDAKRIEKFVYGQKCSIVNCFGKSNLIDAIELMQDVGIEYALGLADADFERIAGQLPQRDGVIHSEFHDHDLDNAFTDVIDRYLEEVADPKKVLARGGIRPCLNDIMLALKPLSVLRDANDSRKLKYNLKQLDIDDFFDGSEIDIDKMIDAVSYGKFRDSASKAVLRKHIDDLMIADLDLFQLTNGHDFIFGLGIALRGMIGDRREPQTWRSEVEMHLRFGLSREDFSSTYVFREIKSWEVQSGFSVLAT